MGTRLRPVCRIRIWVAVAVWLSFSAVGAAAQPQFETTQPVDPNAPPQVHLARLLDEIKRGDRDERRASVRVLAGSLNHLSPWEKPAGPILSVLREHALSSEDEGTREHAYAVLASLGDASAVPLALAGLDDSSPSVRLQALRALQKFGPDRSIDTAPIARLMDEPRCSEAAADALVALRGADAIPSLVDRWNAGQLHGVIALKHLKDYPDPRAAELAAAALATEEHPAWSSAPLLAAMYFESLDRWPMSANVLRAAFEQFAPPPPDKDDDDLADRQREGVRNVAARYLGRVRDQQALDLLLRAASSDPSFEVRTTAVTALGRLGAERAVAIIDAQLDVEDQGRSAEGHVDGALHAAAISALGALAESEAPGALAALYDRIAEDSSFSYTLWRYWSEAHADLARQAIARYRDRPLPDAVAARWFDTITRRNAQSFEVAGDRHEELEAGFRASLQQQPPKPLPDGAAWVENALTFYDIDRIVVARRTVALTYPQWPRRHKSGHTEVYLFRNGQWALLGHTGQWVE